MTRDPIAEKVFELLHLAQLAKEKLRAAHVELQEAERRHKGELAIACQPIAMAFEQKKIVLEREIDVARHHLDSCRRALTATSDDPGVAPITSDLLHPSLLSSHPDHNRPAVVAHPPEMPPPATSKPTGS